MIKHNVLMIKIINCIQNYHPNHLFQSMSNVACIINVLFTTIITKLNISTTVKPRNEVNKSKQSSWQTVLYAMIQSGAIIIPGGENWYEKYYMIPLL